MKQTANIAIIIFFIVAVVWVAMNFTNESPYHKPLSDPEKALDAMLQKIGDDPYTFENAHIRPGPVPKGKGMDYSKMLTPKLVNDLAAQEKRLVAEECNDAYVEGEVCGLDYDPVLCTQDTNDTYVYMTTHQDATTANIEYSWPLGPGRPEKTVADYVLVKTPDGWKIDAVTCAFD